MKLSLYYPVKPQVVNQKFGEISNLQYYLDHGLQVIGHNGMDFYATHGEPIYASHDGTAYYEYDGSQGEGIVLRTNQTFDYEGGQVYFKTIYWHLCDAVKQPQFISPVYKAVGFKPDQTGISNIGIPVKAGDLIGYADTTGLSTGDHLHFGLKPQKMGEPNGTWINLEQGNGYYGAIDPSPYLNGLFAKDIAINEPQPLKYLFKQDFGFLSWGKDVLELQKRLNVKQTYFFWIATRQAVKDYQTLHNIPNTGFVGPLTRSSLNSL